MKKHLLIIAGPTAVGKTSIAVEAALQRGGEIVSADSMQVYKHLDIGTATPTPEEQRGVPYHLIDFVDPSEQYNVAQYIEDADGVIEDISTRGNFSFVVGGTGMYIKALIHGIFEEPGKDKNIRAELEQRVEKEGIEPLYEELQSIDPRAAERIHPGDAMRIIRALEVFRATGKRISTLQKESRKNGYRYRFRLIVLNRDRDELYRRISKRVDTMFERGWIEEVQSLLERGYTPDSPGMKALGYPEIIAYLRGDASLEETRALVTRNTRRYAKRQLTWFRSRKEAEWITITRDNKPDILKKFTEF